jgi:hypothetical protein
LLYPNIFSKKKKKKNKSYTGLEIKKFLSKSTFRKRLFWKFHNKWKFPIAQKLLVKIAFAAAASHAIRCLWQAGVLLVKPCLQQGTHAGSWRRHGEVSTDDVITSLGLPLCLAMVLCIRMARIRSNSSKCLFLKCFFRCSAPKVQHIRMISTAICAPLKRRFLGIFFITILRGTFRGSGKNMFFSLPQRPLQATYGKSIILRLQRTFF